MCGFGGIGCFPFCQGFRPLQRRELGFSAANETNSLYQEKGQCPSKLDRDPQIHTSARDFSQAEGMGMVFKLEPLLPFDWSLIIRTHPSKRFLKCAISVLL